MLMTNFAVARIFTKTLANIQPQFIWNIIIIRFSEGKKLITINKHDHKSHYKLINSYEPTSPQSCLESVPQSCIIS